MSYPEPQPPLHFSFRGFAFLVALSVLCFSSMMPHDKPPMEVWHAFNSLMIFAIFLEVWQIRNPRPQDDPKEE